MGLTAVITIVAVALIAGFAVQYVTKSSLRYEWLVIALAAAFGAYFASEIFPASTVFAGVKDWGPSFDGVYIIPASVGALMLALVADIGIRASSPTPSRA